MAIGVLFAVVMSSSPAAQAVLTASEAHYRSMPASRTSITRTSRTLPNNPYLHPPLARRLGLPPPVSPPQVTTGELTFQNPGMVAYVEDRWASPLGFAFGIEGDTYRQVVGGSQLRVLELDVNKEETMWTFVAALFVLAKPLSSRCDFAVRSTGTVNVVLSGRPLLAGTQWARVDLTIDNATHQVQSMIVVSNRGFEDLFSFGAFVATAPPGRSAFVPVVP